MFLKQRVIGQDQAVEGVCRRLLMAHSQLTPPRGPLGVILAPMIRVIQEAFLAKHGKPLVLTDEAMQVILEQGYSREYGVRLLQRTVQELVEFPLSSLVLSGVPKDWPAVLVAVEQGQVCLQPPSASPM